MKTFSVSGAPVTSAAASALNFAASSSSCARISGFSSATALNCSVSSSNNSSFSFIIESCIGAISDIPVCSSCCWSCCWSCS